MAKIAVIGGGIVGASAAFHLAMHGQEVLLVDANIEGKATSAGAGIVAPGTSLRPLPAFFRLATPAVDYYPVLVDALTDLGIPESGYEVCGKLMIADTVEKAERQSELRSLFETRREDGMPNIGDISILSNEETHQLLPVLGDMEAAMFIAGAARVDGSVMCAALIAGAVKLGTRVLEGMAELVLAGDRVEAVTVNGESHAVDGIVVSAGAWSNILLSSTDYHLPVEPQKGQIIHIEMPGADTSRWPILDWNSAQYQLSFGPNRVVCGATREFHSGFDTRPTPGGLKSILDEHLRLCPGLSHGTLAEIRVGLRPFSDDVLPFIGPLPGYQNITVSTGHGPSGLQLGPYSGLLAAELAQGLTPSADITDFRLDRPINRVEML